jgi:cytochrome c peroxidase
MFQNKVKGCIQFMLVITCVCFVLGLKPAPENTGLINTVNYFRENAGQFGRVSLELKNAVAALDRKHPETITTAKEALKKSRMSYKKIEFFMNYFFESSSLIYNRPAKVEVEEPYIEYQEPSGFQVMEAMLFDKDPVADKESLIAQADVVASSAADLAALLYQFEADDKQILESVRLELIRVITLGITGYDAPELKSGIQEAEQSVVAISAVMQPFLRKKSPEGEKLSALINETVGYLKSHPGFDDFNRMEFLTGFALPMQEQLGGFIHAAGMDLNSKSAINYGAKNIFSPDALTVQAFYEQGGRIKEKAALGKKLFFEQSLSGNLKRNCASCHHPEKYFTDGLKTSLAFDGKSKVVRNAPTLFYAGFQYAQFWDGRAKNLQEQVKAVISNPLEMNGDHQLVIAAIKNKTAYRQDFSAAFPETGTDPVTMDHLADALAAYVMGLAPRNSAFDRFIEGDKKAMTAAQVKGFNLFMGKAQCGSCHFAPLFNGLIPPFYRLTEYEILGTPGNDNFKRLRPGTDKGRYDFFPIRYYEGAFKTPIVRNAARTAPYMHNGAFKSLKKLVEFYNQGGGAGLGLDVPMQSLSAKPLNLTARETREIIKFMQSLTDKPG